MDHQLHKDLEVLKELLISIYPVSEGDLEELLSIWEPFTAKRKEQISTSGHTEKYLYFVLEGVQRVYYFDEKGREATIVFTYAPSFGGVLDSLMLQQPSKYIYEALTPSRFLKAPFHEFNRLMEEKPAIQKIMIKGLSEIISGLMERMTELQSFSSEEKFRKLLTRSPHILQLVPHKYLANYLGIDATNFSKLINKVRL